MLERIVRTLACVLVTAAVFAPIEASAAATAPSVEHGRYIASIGHCAGCHNADAPGAAPRPENYLAGRDTGFFIAATGQIVYARNLTPDPQFGLGKWSVTDIVKAFRTGVTPDGRILQVMPWRDYGVMTDHDAISLALYLKSLPPSHHHVPDPASLESATTPFGLVVGAEEGRKLLAARALAQKGK
jgi:mono/diheme cytochrome c family protein